MENTGIISIQKENMIIEFFTGRKFKEHELYKGDKIEYVHDYIQPDLIDKRIAEIDFVDGSFTVNGIAISDVEITRYIGNIHDDTKRTVNKTHPNAK